MSTDQHWTERSVDAFVQRITFDFATQITKALEGSKSSQADLAKYLGVSEGRVSQILNSPGNLGLKNVVKYARAIGRKVALVLYNDGDSENHDGPVNSEIFSTCWERAGRPADFFAMQTTSVTQISTWVILSSSHRTSGQNPTLRTTWPAFQSESGVDWVTTARPKAEQPQRVQ